MYEHGKYFLPQRTQIIDINLKKSSDGPGFFFVQNRPQRIGIYKGSGRGGLLAPPSSVVGNALVVIDDGIESVNVKNRYQGARVSARRANREPEDGIRWKFVHG